MLVNNQQLSKLSERFTYLSVDDKFKSDSQQKHQQKRAATLLSYKPLVNYVNLLPYTANAMMCSK